jgi:hypothetical protein
MDPIPNAALYRQSDSHSQYGILVFRHASLDDARHFTFSALFGELGDVKPYLALGHKSHFLFDELFDVSNLEDDRPLVKIGSKRHHMLLQVHARSGCGSLYIANHMHHLEYQTPRSLDFTLSVK